MFVEVKNFNEPEERVAEIEYLEVLYTVVDSGFLQENNTSLC